MYKKPVVKDDYEEKAKKFADEWNDNCHLRPEDRFYEFMYPCQYGKKRVLLMTLEKAKELLTKDNSGYEVRIYSVNSGVSVEIKW